MDEDNPSNSAASGTAKTITVEATTGEAMHELGKHVAHLAHGGDVILLSGPLGAGKTTFAQGFGAGLDPQRTHRLANLHHRTRTQRPIPQRQPRPPHTRRRLPTRRQRLRPRPKRRRTPTRRTRMPSDSTKNSKIPATTPSSSWNWGETDGCRARTGTPRNPHRPAAQHRRHRHNGQYGQHRELAGDGVRTVTFIPVGESWQTFDIARNKR